MLPHEADIHTLPVTYPWPIAWLLAALTGQTLPTLSAEDDPWSAIYETAVQHRLAPLLWAQLKERPERAELPPAFMAQLRTVYLANAALSMRYVKELGRILAALDAAGIPAIVLKGAYLAQEVYGNLALRVMGDADLMVPEAHLERAAQVLEGMGYHAGYSYDAAEQKDHHQHLPVYRHPEGILVELHWTFVDPELKLTFVPDDLARVWTTAQTIRLGGAAAYACSPEDTLVHLCIHAAAQHLFFDVGLRAQFDVAQVLRRFGPAMQWPLVLQRARAWGVERPVYLTLLLAAQMAAAPVPPEVLGALEPDELPTAVVRQAAANLFLDSSTYVKSPSFVQLGTAAPASRFVRTILARAFLKPEAMARKYPQYAHSWRLYLCYPMRWGHLIRQYGAGLGDLLRGEPRHREAFYGQEALAGWLRADTP